MKTKWNFLMVLALLAALVGGSASSAQAQEGISDVYPAEGTVGTEVTISGTGFGEKQGEVWLGDEKCKLLDWSDAQITCVVHKPQPPGEYGLAVLLHGDKEPAEMMTFYPFAMQQPRITPGELMQDGNTVTIEGEFFGDKKGDAHLVFRESEIVVEDAKIVDWSMGSIRLELPEGLTGRFILGVRNELGAGVAVLDLGDGPPVVGGLLEPPPAPGYGDIDASANANGVYYKGKFYVFSTHVYCGFFCDEGLDIEGRIFNPSTKSFSSFSVPDGITEATMEALVIADKLYLFYTGQNERMYFAIYDGSTWGSGWHQIPGLINNTFEYAPFFNPKLGRIEVYYTGQDHDLYWIYSDDYGNTWSSGLEVIELGESDFAPSAVYYQPNDSINTLLVVRNTSNEGLVYTLKDGKRVGAGAIHSCGYGVERPFLADLGSASDYIALICTIDDYDYIPMISYMDKESGQWSDAKQALVLPDISGWEWCAQYQFWWPPNAAVNEEPNGSGGVDRVLYLFYSYRYYVCIQDAPSDPKWMMAPIEMPINQPKHFTQVSAGDHHTCALKPSGAVDCWGDNSYGQAADQPGPYTQVDADGWHTCALTPSGAVDCWGDNSYGQAADQPGPYLQVSAGNHHTCALKPSGAVDCWGYNYNHQADDQPGPYLQVSTGWLHNCALTPSGAVDCWGEPSTLDPDFDYGQAEDQPGPYTQVSAGERHNCALTPSGAVDCWGYNYYHQADDQPGPYTQVDAGGWHTCALTPTGAVDCWGDNYDHQADDQPGPYTQVDAGGWHTCAHKSDDTLFCWGENDYGQTTVP